MGAYNVSTRVEIDLAKIYEYGIETFGLKKAQQYLSGIHHLFQLLADNIHLGRDASEFIESLKRFSYKSHIIFYLCIESKYGIMKRRLLQIRILAQTEIARLASIMLLFL